MEEKFIVIEVSKTTSAGHPNIVYLIANKEEEGCETNEELAEMVAKDWAEKDPGGYYNGYSLKWDIVKDKDVMTIAVNKEIKRVEEKIKSLNGDLEKLNNWAESENIKVTNTTVSEFLLNEGYEILECPWCEKECKPDAKRSDGTIVYETHLCKHKGLNRDFEIRRSFEINVEGELVE